MNSNSNVSLQKKLRFELPDMKNNNSDTDTDDNVENKKYYEIDQYSEESSSDKYDEDSDMKLSDDSESEDNITDDDDDDNDDKNDGGDNDGDDNEDDDYNLLKGLKWVKADLVSNIPDFEDTSGLSKDINLPSSPSPMDFFSLFLTQDLIKYIIEQSNLYSIQQKLKIKPMDESELRKLIGFLFYGSVVQLPSKCDYWREQSRQLIISDNISRNRIEELLRMLHFSNNTVAGDKCDKVQPLIDFFNQRSKLLLKPEEFVAIDEHMVGFKGKTAPSSLKQYMPNKPSKHGFKLWSKSGVSGYVYHIEIYSGSKKNSVKPTSSFDNASLKLKTRSAYATSKIDRQLLKRSEDRKAVGLSGLVVLDLAKDSPRGTKFFADNYFGSVALIRKMTTLGYERGFYDYCSTNDKQCIVVVWKDTKRVLIGSNQNGINPVGYFKRWNKDQKKKVDVPAPEIVRQYNKYMGGVDTTGMLCSLHPIQFRSKKWYMRLVWRIFDLMILNSWLISKFILGRDGNWRIERLFEFKLYIARALLQTSRYPTPVTFKYINDGSNKVDSSNESDDDTLISSSIKRGRRESKLSVSNDVRYDSYNH
ncbi:unnamed protein product [Rotaria magnacalcarata]|uniref:PiggyBac transposable element-derived protein domain-containing protein n=2 Tax=Rotaria magnacalcarata TaxID=392030 RepID=A0A814RD40_9BILA|nr:unnamed protein product [Rotaria magnacalcarata]CAF1380307.1 unnamed protein product [Rotaria magnacalcarata]CAF2161436.1 unnamed protein product [Rotaria magnacalcarata]CAF3804134.1 unnamed protein product [Rotaria magnacalcarata]CAF3807858.1 unnamed protein product [Rotaria magnacalcarata]